MKATGEWIVRRVEAPALGSPLEEAAKGAGWGSGPNGIDQSVGLTHQGD